MKRLSLTAEIIFHISIPSTISPPSISRSIEQVDVAVSRVLASEDTSPATRCPPRLWQTERSPSTSQYTIPLEPECSSTPASDALPELNSMEKQPSLRKVCKLTTLTTQHCKHFGLQWPDTADCHCLHNWYRIAGWGTSAPLRNLPSASDVCSSYLHQRHSVERHY
ncbi:hypothetical protein BCV69DRAFT_77295 [Microstroma glucosiphilum]|uniref:Uncharacterized protein n=1 Tax=Pseudomicrostroma glucosiphilum TaxID=1684307 RepID=A0A316TZ85_9BASI|nr:hypothetical protein BCV69DRAFT_77295 [Pseudomicrostroma glucosiphilum]PWN18539.1 hypothetical protein BCV69DRAFT_77295 [Pseudomicrostroma glucosiphilum]